MAKNKFEGAKFDKYDLTKNIKREEGEKKPESYREMGRERVGKIKEKTKVALERSKGLGERAGKGLKRIGKAGVEYGFAIPELLKDAGKAGADGIKSLGARANDWAEKKFAGMAGWALEKTALLYSPNEIMARVFQDKIREAVEIYKDFVDQRREARKAGKLSEQRQKLETWTGKQKLNPERRKVVNGKIISLNNIDRASEQLSAVA